MAYFSNSTEGSVLDQQCRDCRIGGEGELGVCPVAFVQLQYNYKQLDRDQEDLKDAMTHLIDDDGVCQMKKQIDDVIERRYQPGQLLLPEIV